MRISKEQKILLVLIGHVPPECVAGALSASYLPNSISTRPNPLAHDLRTLHDGLFLLRLSLTSHLRLRK